MSFDSGYILLACMSSAISGFGFYSAFRQSYDVRERHKKILDMVSPNQGAQRATFLESDKLSSRIIQLVCDQSSLKRTENKRSSPMFEKTALRSFDYLVLKSGLKTRVSKEGYLATRIRVTFFGLIGGALVGLIFSSELAALSGILGVILGWSSVPWAFKQEIRARSNNLEKHLSEMIEIISLGLRSGLSFDHSLSLYHGHFSTSLGKTMEYAQQQWVTGFLSREVALRELAQSYDSVLLSRVVENIIRSLRFGASLADSLDVCAVESRTIHKAKVEERVAKAPVKMLLPTGTLILPAMLLFVLGPVLIDLMQGF